MTDVTASQGQDGAELSAADEQLLRELTERARTGGLKLTGEGGLLGKLTKMVVGWPGGIAPPGHPTSRRKRAHLHGIGSSPLSQSDGPPTHPHHVSRRCSNASPRAGGGGAGGSRARQLVAPWALSTSAEALPAVLALCPPGARVAAWHRGERPTRGRWPLHAWKPVIYSGGRQLDSGVRRVDSIVCGVGPWTRCPAGCLAPSLRRCAGGFSPCWARRLVTRSMICSLARVLWAGPGPCSPARASRPRCGERPARSPPARSDPSSEP